MLKIDIDQIYYIFTSFELEFDAVPDFSTDSDILLLHRPNIAVIEDDNKMI